MQDILQRALEAAASADLVLRAIAVVCADWVAYVAGVVALAAVVWRRDRLTPAMVARVALAAALALGIAVVLSRVVPDPRPFIAAHTRPLIAVSADNGFPSDHVLLAAFFTSALWWFERRLIPVCALLTLLVMVGRLAVGAHHALDVVGSVAIVLVAFAVAALLPLPAALGRPIFARSAVAVGR